MQVFNFNDVPLGMITLFVKGSGAMACVVPHLRILVTGLDAW